MTHLEDGQGALLDAARRGDRDALEAWLGEQQPRIYSYAMRMCGDPVAAEEVLQDTLLAAARGLGGFRGDAAPSTWLFTIARNACSKRRRRDRKHDQERAYDAEIETITSLQASPEARAAARELGQIVVGAIDALAHDYREALVLRDIQGLSTPEVAELLGITPAAVKSRLHRARAQVREQIAPVLAEAAPPPAPSCPNIVQKLSRYLEGELSPTDCAVMEHHVRGCEACETRSRTLRRALAICREAREEVVPTEVQNRVRDALRTVLAGVPAT